jgi:hypothetical protein
MINFPVLIDEFDDDYNAYIGLVKIIHNEKELKEAKIQYISQRPISYTFVDANNNLIV